MKHLSVSLDIFIFQVSIFIKKKYFNLKPVLELLQHNTFNNFNE